MAYLSRPWVNWSWSLVSNVDFPFKVLKEIAYDFSWKWMSVENELKPEFTSLSTGQYLNPNVWLFLTVFLEIKNTKNQSQWGNFWHWKFVHCVCFFIEITFIDPFLHGVLKQAILTKNDRNQPNQPELGNYFKILWCFHKTCEHLSTSAIFSKNLKSQPEQPLPFIFSSPFFHFKRNSDI